MCSNITIWGPQAKKFWPKIDQDICFVSEHHMKGEALLGMKSFLSSLGWKLWAGEAESGEGGVAIVARKHLQISKFILDQDDQYVQMQGDRWLLVRLSLKNCDICFGVCYGFTGEKPLVQT